ncbi:MAG: glycosyltransferase family 1 protein [Cyanobacteria bacterium SIG28]|nr:glycosyltransferase family 1 protein [Cyanobacteria bacterium SIG28]
MKKTLSKLLTLWIPVKSVRKKARKGLEYLLYVNSPKYKKALKTLINELENKDNIFAIVSISWGFLFQRPQHLAIQISNKNYTFLYAENWGSDLSLKRIDNIIFIDYTMLDLLPNHIAKKIVIIEPSTDGFYTYKNLLKYKSKGYKIIYDYIDDFDEKILGEDNSIQLNVFKNLEKISHDKITVTAKRLYNQLLQRFPEEKLVLVPNAVNIENFTNIPSAVPDDMIEIVNQNKPIVGYYGAMAPWLDYDLINEVTRRKKDYNFVYIGVDYQEALKNLEILDNVYFLGPKKYEELPQYAQFFTCCTIPFECGEIAKATNPLKLHEYMALKKPVVCTKDLLECYGYDGVYIADSVDDFCEKLDLAIAEANNVEKQDALWNYAANNTWEQRAIDFISIAKSFNK